MYLSARGGIKNYGLRKIAMEKQKKHNRLSDIGEMVQRLSEDKLRFLWRGRIINQNFADKNKISSTDLQSKIADRRKPINLLETHNEESITDNFNSDSKNLPATTYQLQPNLVDGNDLMSFTNSPAAKFSRRREIYRAIAGFTALSLIILSAFPLFNIVESNRQARSAVLGVATGAYERFTAASSALLAADFTAASAGFTAAYNEFSLALEEFSGLSAAASMLPEGETAKELLLAATDASLSMQYLSAGMEGMVSARISNRGISTNNEKEASIVFSESLNNISLGINYLQAVEARLLNLDSRTIPEQYRKQIEAIRETFSATSSMFTQAKGMLGLLSALTSGGEQKFLLLFQNHRELRATGGFIGTYGLLHLNGGSIESLKIDTVYNPDGQLQEKIAAPGPLQRQLTPTWAMRDSNWFFDFPTSAAKAAEFFKKETDTKVDGVVAFTPAVFKRFMQITGPIEMPEYGQTLTAENFIDIVQYETSVAYDRVLNQPKKFLADFTLLMLDRVSNFSTAEWLQFLDAIMVSLVSRDIQAESFNNNFSQIGQLGWNGALRQAPHDFLSVVHSNVGAGKTDQNINQEINLESVLDGDGRITNTLTVTRTHTPGSEKEFPVNLDFMRVYVPLNSELVSASGFDSFPYAPSWGEGLDMDEDLAVLDQSVLIHADSGTLVLKETGKTVFANWIELAPGETQVVRLEYKLPLQYNTASSNAELYSILVQRQAGAPPTEFNYRFFNASPLSAIWDHSNEAGEGAVRSSLLERDFVWGTILNNVSD